MTRQNKLNQYKTFSAYITLVTGLNTLAQITMFRPQIYSLVFNIIFGSSLVLAAIAVYLFSKDWEALIRYYDTGVNQALVEQRRLSIIMLLLIRLAMAVGIVISGVSGFFSYWQLLPQIFFLR